jgi:RimJ/RimL family protein N-acetyltransferase
VPFAPSDSRVATPRLVLTPLTPDDVDAVFTIYGDPETWRHLPFGRHDRRDQSSEVVNESIASTRASGLGQWAVRVGAAAADAELPEGSFIGTGGLTMTPVGVWNLGYRLAPRSWGRGFATEISHAAVEIARGSEGASAVTVRVLSNNPASAAVARRAGLDKVWEGSTSAPADPGVYGEIYSDQPLDQRALAWLIARV